MSHKKYENKKAKNIYPKKIPSSVCISGTEYIGTYNFLCGNEVPIFEACTVHGLNQLIGHAKFNNQAYGNVYYRGECKLHESIKPSLFRKGKNAEKMTEKITTLIQKFMNDDHMKRELKMDSNNSDIDKIKVEGVLQHYGIPTRYIDVVDNHWVALWMGLNKAEKYKKINHYYHYAERNIPLVEFAKGIPVSDEFLFQYVLLLAVPFSENQTSTGVRISANYIEVDLRQALPSLFLRPHAQHGLVLRRKVHSFENKNGTDKYDMAPSIIGIIRIRIDKVHEWIGSGELLTQNNLFPPPAYGYDLLLTRNDLFADSEFSIARYV